MFFYGFLPTFQAVSTSNVFLVLSVHGLFTNMKESLLLTAFKGCEMSKSAAQLLYGLVLVSA